MSGTKVLRSLLHELRLSSPNGCIKDSLVARYILDQYKKHQTTELLHCKARNEAMFLGQTYLTYLESLRKHKELYKQFHASGERSVRETADLVGFKLPTDPK
ncbi:hypothetical protein KR009_010372 [Drosophila setifemur]|nr:hypothetical protein KR009_010372 [Drosophila setifemur]